MQSKIMQIFYGNDCLPYLDSSRQIHYPVVGSANLSANNTTTIRFYVRDIGGTENISWVVVSKLPNGKIGYEHLTTQGEDKKLKENYLEFDVSEYYTQLKGNVFISLRGYDGDISFIKQKDNTYQIVGNPMIQVTRPINLCINYTPYYPMGNQVLPTDIDMLIATLSEYAKIFNSIVVYRGNISSLDLSGYGEGQVFLNIKTNGEFQLYKKLNGAISDEVVFDKFEVKELHVPQYIQGGQDKQLQFYEAGVLTILVGQKEFTFNSDGSIEIDGEKVATEQKVNELISDFKENELTIVNTTTYPTLNDFLASQGEEGFIYLYPINTSDLSEGFYRYIWEEVSGTYQWVSLGTTEIDLSDYYNKTETDTLLNGKVDKTSSANKVYGTNELGTQTTYTVDDFYEGNVARRDTDGSITVPLTPTQNGHASSKKYVDDLTTLKTINGVDLHGTGNITYDTTLDDSSTNAVQNKVLKGYLDDIGTRLATLEESIIADDTLNYTYLIQSAIPTNSNTYPILESAGMDNTDIKGHSFVYNQQVENGNFESTSGWVPLNTSISSFSVSNNKCILTSMSGAFTRIYRSVNIVAGHKNLVTCYTKANFNSDALCNFYLQNGSTPDTTAKTNYRLTPNGTTSLIFILTATNNCNRLELGVNNTTANIAAANDTMEISNVQIFDLTQSGIDSATTADEAIALLQQNGINPYEYNPYNVGKINDSKPTALISHGFNLWDEEWEQGDISNGLGTNTSGTNRIRSKNYIRVVPNSAYYFYASNDYSEIDVIAYDINKNYIGVYISPDGFKPSGSSSNVKGTYKIVPNNCYFIRFKALGKNTYNNDICINISNASLNGTYRPYKAPISYPLNLPVLRSAGSVQDNVSKVNIGVVDLGTLNWTWSGVSEGFKSELPLAKQSNAIKVLIANCFKLSPNYNTYSNLSTDKAIFKTGNNNDFYIKDNSWSSSTNINSVLSGVMLNYELATPTDQSAITLPENIEFEKGGSLEVVYDSTAPTPSDFDFEVAVYKPIQ